MRWTIKHSIQATLLYAGIFEFPLTETEIIRFLITPKGSKLRYVPTALLNGIPHRKRYYSDCDIVKRVALRERRKEISIKKWNIAKQGVQLLSIIPTIHCIGISGGLSMNNADLEDDIDVFIICYEGTIWTTRLVVLIIISLLGKRRKFGDVDEQDLLCANMFMTHNHLRLPYHSQDLYSAHEIVQLKPLFIRGDTYKRFLLENAWVANYVPNAWKWAMGNVQQSHSYSVHIGVVVGRIICYVLNPLCRLIQLMIMRSHKTNEIITDTVLQFHPDDARSGVRQQFTSLLREHHIPLDSHFFRVLR